MNTTAEQYEKRPLVQEVADGWNGFWYTRVDPYGLCVIRILTGMISLYFAASFTPELIRWFGHDGILNRETVRALSGDFHLSYFNWTTKPAELWILHIAGLVVLTLFTAGFITRITSILAVVVMISYIQRAPMITGLAEPVVVMLMLYLCIAPCGTYLSVDRLLQVRRATGWGEDLTGSWSANISMRLIQVHLAALYLMMGMMKLGGTTWWSGQAVWWLLAHPDSRLVDLTFLHRSEFLLNAWTHAIVLFELTFGILIWNRVARPLLLWTACIVWPSVALATGLIWFAAIMLVANLAFVPPQKLRSLFRKKSGMMVTA